MNPLFFVGIFLSDNKAILSGSNEKINGDDKNQMLSLINNFNTQIENLSDPKYTTTTTTDATIPEVIPVTEVLTTENVSVSFPSTTQSKEICPCYIETVYKNIYLF